MSESSEKKFPDAPAAAVSAKEEKNASEVYERFEPTIVHTMALHHFHRYFFAARHCAGKRVLDIACGSGYGTDILGENAESVLGVDIDGETIRKCRETYRNDRLRFVQGSVEKIPAEDAAFDVVVSFETIEHVDEQLQKQFLREIRRVLRPGGLLIISSPSRDDRTNNRFHIHELREEEFLELLRANFRRCRLWKQKIVLGSFIHNTDTTVAPAELFGIRAEVDAPIVRTPPDIDSKYSIALCSDSEVPEVGDSLNLDVSGRIMDAMIRQFVLRSSQRQREAEKKIAKLEQKRREERRWLRLQLAERGGGLRRRDLLYLAVHALRHPRGTFRLWREMRLIRRSGLFSEQYYRSHNPNVAAKFRGSMLLHFCLTGWREGRDPSVLFDVSEYLRRHPMPEGRETNPLVCHIRAGMPEETGVDEK